MIRRTPIRKVRSKPRRGRIKGKDMEALRRVVFVRDHFRCQHVLRRDENGEPLVICGKEVTWDSGHLCHRRNRRMWGDNPENTFCGCQECHIGKQHAYGPSMEKPVPKKPIDTD